MLGQKMGYEISASQVQYNLQITRKRTNKTEASYTLEGRILENVDSIKYLGVTITQDEMEYTFQQCVLRQIEL